MNKRAQSTLEYAVIIAVVIGALIAMQTFMKRGVEGKLRSSIDDIGGQYAANATDTHIKTTYKGTQSSTETFGYAAGGTSEKQGVSHYKVNQVPDVTKTTDENVTDTLSNETLF